jgi:prevent-host-death family protein
MKEIPKSKFKPKAFEFFRQVEAGETLVVSDNGRPVARIVPYSEEGDDAVGSLRGAVVRYTDPTEPVGENTWESSVAAETPGS